MLYNDFFKMEQKYHLFDIQTGDGLAIWDIIRLHVYLKYHYPEIDTPTLQHKQWSLRKHLAGIFQSIFYFLKHDGENLIFPFSRYLNSNEMLYDKAAMNVINCFGKNCFITEWHDPNRKYAYSSFNNYITLFTSFRKRTQSLDSICFNKISNALIDTLGESKITYEEINAILVKFQAEYHAYKVLIKIKKAKNVFFTQNGIQKALIKAAQDCGATVYEFQHGAFEIDHLAYSYPDNISFESHIIFPNYLLTFSEYWGSYFHVPAEKIIATGNDYFNVIPKDVATDGSILIISSMIHGKELYPLAIKLAENYPAKIIKFKLHSNESQEYAFYSELFHDVSNITLIQNEQPTEFLIAQSELVVLIHSTVIYEALNQNKKVAIYKRVNYEGLETLFLNKNVYLFDQYADIEIILKQVIINSLFPYFNSFSKDVFTLTCNKHYITKATL